MMVAKMKKGPCCGMALLASFCIVYTAVGTWPRKSGAEVPATEQVPSESESVPEKRAFVNFPRPSETLSESLPFRYFDSSQSYQTEGVTGRALTRHELELLQPVKEAATQHLRQMHPQAAFVNGRYRWLPTGAEFDLYFEDPSAGVSSRITLYQKLEVTKVINSFTVDQDTQVNIIVPLKGHVSKYTIFLDHLVRNVVPHDPNLSLTVVYFSDSNISEVQNLTTKRLEGLPGFKWSFVPVDEKEFSRGHGLHVGAQSTTKNNGGLLFFCDVDVLMHHDFFNRCRSNTRKGYQVYYPVVFSLYNPKLVYPLFDKGIPPINEQLVVDVQSGFWRTFGFGMACMYGSDYEMSGGFPDIRSWGGEDVALYEKFLKMKDIKVIRAPDPSLFHLYHRKVCTDTNSVSYPACLKSKAVTEGSQLQLGLSLIKLHEGIDLEGILSKRFYYFWLIPYLGGLLILSLLINLVQAIVILNRRSQNYRKM
ncbi:chondroitin sulfate N-acetylgalactosaminyltransferase 1-like isoform X3 [Penaeus japonicus]|uniref:chondroitin sulfate N-acetylgalactosaminyltransferase 1-like isoform X3 n=1 Tax=Penaeus japonicus TaxID=27405 RepID=UPI001C7176B5|nr:chondroitin sulfate N-acetylgalactosaminyltransferase 1-like isoform X3 [Penaeus japonicus]